MWGVIVFLMKGIYMNTCRDIRPASAYLDMFERFPNPFTNKFRRLRNVVVWPGVTAISRESRERLKELVVYNLEQLKSGNPVFLNLL